MLGWLIIIRGRCYTSFIIILIMTMYFIPVKKFYYEIIIASPRSAALVLGKITSDSLSIA